MRLGDGNIKIHWESSIWVSSRLPLLLRLGDGNIRTHWGVLVLGLAFRLCLWGLVYMVLIVVLGNVSIDFMLF